MPARKSALRLTALLLAGATLASPALGQEAGGLEDIIVTAQKRAENLQATPIAITALTSSALEAQGITDLKGMVLASPNLYFVPYPSSATTLVLYMRGQGVGDPMLITQDGGIGIYVDGFYQARPQAAAFDLADVERTEVLRGPQGTLYGRNTTGGAVNIITKKPTGELNLRGTLSLGNLGARRALLNLDLPEFHNFKVKLSGIYSARDGWQKNRNAPGNDESNNFQYDKKLGFRGAIRWEPTDTVTVDYAGDVSSHQTTPTLYVTDSPFAPVLFPGYTDNPDKAWRSIYIPKSKVISDGQSLTVEWAASEAFTLRSLSSYRHVKMRNYQDYAEAFLAPFTAYDEISSKAYTQEFQAVGRLNESFRYVGGLYYFHENVSHLELADVGIDPTSALRADRTASVKSTSLAAYGQVTVSPAFAEHQLELTLGGRFTSDKRRAHRHRTSDLYMGTVSELVWRQFNPPGTIISLVDTVGSTYVKNSKFSPAVTLTWLPSDAFTLYGKIVTGYKAGGSHEGSPFFTRTYGPETVTSYEVGLKSEFFERRLRLNLAGYVARYKDLQISMQADANDLSLGDTFNVGRATVKGIEAELTAAPLDGLTLSASYAYTHQKLSHILAPVGSNFDRNNNPDSPTLAGDDITGYFVIPFTPKNSLRLSGDWQVGQVGPGTLALHADYTWKDKVYTTAGAGPVVPGRQFAVDPSFTLVNGRISYTLEQPSGRDLTIALWGQNLFNKRYSAFVIGTGSVQDGYIASSLAYGMPRTYGVDVNFSF